jgi:LacI family transcriptional regulator
MSTKYLEIAESVARRLRQGDYLLNEIPGERKLAAEFGVSYMTGRKAIRHLVDRGMLPPRAAGRAAVRRAPVDHDLSVAFVVPAFTSPIYNEWRMALERVAQRHHAKVRTVPYVSWHDPVLATVLDSAFDGVFLVPLTTAAPDLLRQRLHVARRRLVTLFEDMTDLGVPCVDGGDPRSIDRLIDHLHVLGHRRVDCLNTEPDSDVVHQRIELWARGLRERGMAGDLRNEAVAPFEAPDLKGYDAAARFLASSDFTATALFCTSAAAAIGLYRAAYERGVKIGKDLSVCVPDGTDRARLMTPSLTTLQTPDFDALLARAMEWIVRRGGRWNGSMQIRMADVNVVAGESTGAPPRKLKK